MRLVLLLAATLSVLAAAPVQAQPSEDAAPDANDRATWAPTAQGVRLLGGYASASAFVHDVAYLNVSPQIGRFVADGLALSLRVEGGVSRSSFTNVELVDGRLVETDLRSSSYNLALGPAVTKYFGTTGAAVYPFVGMGASASLYRSSGGVVGEPSTPSTSWALAGSARVGVMVPVARNVSIEAQIVGDVYDLSPAVRGSAGFSAGISTFLY